MSERRRGVVKRQDEVRGAQRFDGAQEHLGEAVDAANFLTRATQGERILDGVEGPMNHRMAIKEHQER